MFNSWSSAPSPKQAEKCADSWAPSVQFRGAEAAFELLNAGRG